MSDTYTIEEIQKRSGLSRKTIENNDFIKSLNEKYTKEEVDAWLSKGCTRAMPKPLKKKQKNNAPDPDQTENQRS